VTSTASHCSVHIMPGRVGVLLLVGLFLAGGAVARPAEEDASLPRLLRQAQESPLLEVSAGLAAELAAELALPDEESPAEPRAEPIAESRTEAAAADTPLLDKPEEVFARESVSPALLDDVSARAADGLRVDEFTLEEMPFESSSGKWFSSGEWYGSAEVLMLSRSRNYRRVMGYDPTVVGLPNPSLRPNLAGTFVTTGVPWDLVPGARLTIGEHLGRDHLDRDQSVEFTYYGGLSFFVRDSYNAMPQSISGNASGWYHPAGIAGVHLRADLRFHDQLQLQQHGAQLQARPPAGPRPTDHVARRRLVAACGTGLAAFDPDRHEGGERQ